MSLGFRDFRFKTFFKERIELMGFKCLEGFPIKNLKTGGS